MPINTKAQAYQNLLDIIAKVDDVRQRQKDEVNSQKRLGYILTPDKKKQLAHKEKVAVMAAEERLSKLKKDYIAFVEKASAPFTENTGVSGNIKITSLSKDDMALLNSLDYMPPLKPTHIKRLLDNYRNENNPAMLLALSEYASKNGFKVNGLEMLTDPDGMVAEFDSAIKKAQRIIKGVSEEDGFGKVNLEIFRDELNQLWDDSLVKNSDGSFKHDISVEKIPQTAEEEITQDLERQAKDQSAPDETEEKYQVIRAIAGEEEANTYLEALATAQVDEIRAEKKQQSDELDRVIAEGKEEAKEREAEALKADGYAFGSNS